VTADTVSQSALAAAAGVTVSATASCPAGKKVLGGGARAGVTAGPAQRVVLKESYASGPSSWTGVAIVITALAAANRGTITVSAVCTV
jgi:hypothetical protein